MKIFFIRLIRGAGYFFATALILAAVLVGIAHLITPLLNRHRTEFEGWASALLQVPITIGEIHADWRGNIPELTLTHVVTLDKVTHKPAFDMQEIKFGFQLFSSLWKRKIVLQDIIISGTDVTIVQDAAGGLTIKDLPIEKGKEYQAYQLINILGWIFSQPYLALRDIEVCFIPAKGEKRVLSITQIALVNNREKHRINGNFVLHQDIPMEVKTRIEWYGSLNDREHIKAQAYFDVEGVSLSQWLPGKNHQWSKLFSGWQIYHGVGGASVWLDWQHNQLQQAQSVFQWYDLEFYSERDKKIYPIDRLSGHVGWKREGEQQIVAGDNILINFPNHLWPATTFYFALSPDQIAWASHAHLTKQEQQVVAPSAAKTASQLKKNKLASPVAKATVALSPDSSQLTESLVLVEEGIKKHFAGDHAWRLQSLRIGYLDWQDLLPILLANASIPEQWHKNLVVLGPLGELQNFAASWQGDLTEFTKMTLSLKFKGLTFNSWQKFPGLANGDGSLNWDRDEGTLTIASKNLYFTLPALFADTLFFDKVNAVVDFQYDDSAGWFLRSKQAEITNADVNLKAALQMTIPLKGSPGIDMSADFSLAKVTQVAHYLPAKIMVPALVAWLRDAFLSGRIAAGKVLIQGKLSEFPFAKTDLKKDQNGKFEVSGELKGVDFHYAPQWPLLQQANGRLLFSGRSMTAVIDSASILDIPVKRVSGVIPYLGTEQPQVVTVQAQLQTDLAQGLDFIHQSPLEQVIGKDLASVQLKGAMDLALSLSVPLANPEKSTVLGTAQLTQGVLALPDWNLSVDQLNGALQFTEQALSAKQLQGRLWGEPTVLRLSTVLAQNKKPSYVAVDVSGKISVADLQNASQLSFSQFLSGSTAYQVKLKLYQSNTANNEVYLSSNLQGITVELPQPFGKTAAQKRDFALHFVLQQRPGFKTQLKYADLVQAQLNIMLEQNARVIDIDSRQVKGRVTVPYPFTVKQPITAQLDRLIISAGNAAQTMSSIDPHTVPPLVINSKQFTYGNKNLGQLNLVTNPKPNGMAIQNFSLSAADYIFQSKGQWTVSGQSQQSQLQGTIQSAKVNRFLDRLGLSLRSLIVDKGQSAFDLHWKGAPYSFSLATLSGDFSFALERGRIINLNEADNNKMDMGRMLSLFSLQTIPRRLSLDFSDLFEKGYSFDFMRGDFSLKQGSAFTQKPAVFEGPVAHVAASGRIGFLAQDYDLNLSISPYVTDSLPVVAGALTLNPFVGAAAWLVNKVVLSKEVSRVVTYNYKVTGSWNAPVWRSVQGNNKAR